MKKNLIIYLLLTGIIFNVFFAFNITNQESSPKIIIQTCSFAQFIFKLYQSIRSLSVEESDESEEADELKKFMEDFLLPGVSSSVLNTDIIKYFYLNNFKNYANFLDISSPPPKK